MLMLFDKEKKHENFALTTTSVFLYEHRSLTIDYEDLSKCKGNIEIVHDHKGDFHSFFFSYTEKSTDPKMLNKLNYQKVRVILVNDIIEIHLAGKRYYMPLSGVQSDFLRNTKSLCDTYDEMFAPNHLPNDSLSIRFIEDL